MLILLAEFLWKTAFYSGDTAEIPLTVGSKLTVQLNSDASDNISYVIEKLTEDSLPEEILRIFAADPDLLDEACISAGWDKKLIEDRNRT